MCETIYLLAQESLQNPQVHLPFRAIANCEASREKMGPQMLIGNDAGCGRNLGGAVLWVV